MATKPLQSELPQTVPGNTPRSESPCAACKVRDRAICAPLSSADLQIVERFRTGTRHVPAGTELLVQGEPSQELFTLLNGWAFDYQLLEDGRRQIDKIALPGDFLGFQADLARPMGYSVQTLTASAVCVFPRRNLIELFREHPDLALRLTWMVARDESLARERLTSVGRRSALERIAYFLLELYYRVRTRTDVAVGAEIPLPLTQEHIGDALGLTSVHVNRTLRELRELNLLHLANRRLHVLDPDGLAELAGADEDSFVEFATFPGPGR